MTPRKVTLVASELLGVGGAGGAGTADSLLAVELARHGHRVELLVASGGRVEDLTADWHATYAGAGVRIRSAGRAIGIEPAFLAPAVEVFDALRAEPPDVAIVNDWRGLGYAALSARNVGRALSETAFVVHCHGPGRVLAEFAQKVPDTVERFGEEVTERASLALADAVVSPSEWLLGWMRSHGWPVPASARVIQYVRQPALHPPAPQAPITRFAFFGQLREGKGIRIFLDALERLGPPDDVIFLGRESKRWTREAILRLVPTARVETDLSREAALEELRTAGTLAVMPSLLDNSPNTVSECIENGIPFVSTNTGGIPELVAEQDRARVLCEPTAAALAERLGTALRDGFTPARPARAAQASVDAWLEVVDSVRPRPRVQMSKASGVSLVAGGPRAEARARAVATAVSTVDVEVVAAGSRREGLAEAKAPWIVFLDDEDELDDGLLDALVAAQAATQADIVTTAVRSRAGVRLFLGEPGAFGLLANHYGVVGLVRRELLSAHRIVDDGPDPDWPLFARLALAGARIVSVPEPLATHAPQPGQVGDVPGQALRVLDAFEAAGEVRDLPQLAATLAAAYARTARASGNALPREGRVAALARRARARLS